MQFPPNYIGEKKYFSHLGGCLAPETIAKFEAAAPEDEATVAVVVARLLREASERIVPLGCLGGRDSLISTTCLNLT